AERNIAPAENPSNPACIPCPAYRKKSSLSLFPSARNLPADDSAPAKIAQYARNPGMPSSAAISRNVLHATPCFPSTSREIVNDCAVQLPNPTPVTGWLRTMSRPALKKSLRTCAPRKSPYPGCNIRDKGDAGESSIMGSSNTVVKIAARRDRPENTIMYKIATHRPINPPRDDASVKPSNISTRETPQNHRCSRAVFIFAKYTAIGITSTVQIAK